MPFKNPPCVLITLNVSDENEVNIYMWSHCVYYTLANKMNCNTQEKKCFATTAVTLIDYKSLFGFLKKIISNSWSFSSPRLVSCRRNGLSTYTQEQSHLQRLKITLLKYHLSLQKWINKQQTYFVYFLCHKSKHYHLIRSQWPYLMDTQ